MLFGHGRCRCCCFRRIDDDDDDDENGYLLMIEISKYCYNIQVYDDDDDVRV